MSFRTHIRDPVHGFIRLSDEEAAVINTPVYQRLRGIKQLAFAHLLYPGALHSRFEHSLGVTHMADMMLKRLDFDMVDRRIPRLAALLHDLGHGPFSHVSEASLERFSERSRLGDRTKTSADIHELVTCDIICSNPDLVSLLGEATCDKIAELILGGDAERVVKDVISGPLDADKQDYLLRDSYFCGVPYGHFDPHQLHRALCRLTDESAGSTCLGIRPNGVNAVEQFVLAKYYMTSQVYCHRVRLITDEMLTRAIALGVEHDEITELCQMYSYHDSEEYIAAFTDWDDARLLLSFTGDKFQGTLCFDLLKRLMERELFKEAFRQELPELDLPAQARRKLQGIMKPGNVSARSQIEARLADEISRVTGETVRPEFVILKQYTIKSVRKQSRNSEGSILVNVPTGPPKPFEEKSALFRSIDESQRVPYVAVYAPLSYQTLDQKRAILANLHDPVINALAQSADERSTTDADGDS